MNIALDDIRKQAPQGATHYDIEDGYVFYWALTEKGFSFYNAWCNVWYLENTDGKEIKPLN